MRFSYSLALVLTAACGSSATSYGNNPPPPPPAPPPAPAPGTSSVSIGDFNFTPASVSVRAGTTVKWTNNGSTSHSVTADDGSFNSGNLGGSMPDPYDPYTSTPGASFQQVFNTPGSYPYHCTLHSNMTGTITVTQ